MIEWWSHATYWANDADWLPKLHIEKSAFEESLPVGSVVAWSLVQGILSAGERQGNGLGGQEPYSRLLWLWTPEPSLHTRMDSEPWFSHWKMGWWYGELHMVKATGELCQGSHKQGAQLMRALRSQPWTEEAHPPTSGGWDQGFSCPVLSHQPLPAPHLYFSLLEEPLPVPGCSRKKSFQRHVSFREWRM